MRISDWSSDVCSSDLPTLRFRNVEPTPPPPSRPPPGHGHGHRGHGYGYGGGGYWVRDECHALPQREVCARLRDRREQIRQRRFNAQANERARSEEHTSELQSLMRISYAVFCLNKKNNNPTDPTNLDMRRRRQLLDVNTLLL